MAGDAVQRHRERVGEHGLLVGEVAPGRGTTSTSWAGQQVRVSAGRVAGHAGVDAGLMAPSVKLWHRLRSPAAHAGHTAAHAARRAGQPRVEHDPLADIEPPRLGAERDDLADHLVAHDLGERAEGGHRVVALALAEVEQGLLGVDPQMPVMRGRMTTQSGAGWRIGHVHQPHRCAGQVAHQRVGVLRRLERLRRTPKTSALMPSRRPVPEAGAMRGTIDVGFLDVTTDFRSGR